MAGKADFLENQLLDHVFRAVSIFATPANVYIALFTTTPTGDDGTGGTEVTGGAYARVTAATGTGNWKDPSTATQGQTKNLVKLVFPVATANWGTINGMGIYDASGGGNLYYFGDITTPTAVNSGSQAFFEINDITVAEA